MPFFSLLWTTIFNSLWFWTFAIKTSASLCKMSPHSWCPFHVHFPFDSTWVKSSGGQICWQDLSCIFNFIFWKPNLNRYTWWVYIIFPCAIPCDPCFSDVLMLWICTFSLRLLAEPCCVWYESSRRTISPFTWNGIRSSRHQGISLPTIPFYEDTKSDYLRTCLGLWTVTYLIISQIA